MAAETLVAMSDAAAARAPIVRRLRALLDAAERGGTDEFERQLADLTRHSEQSLCVGLARVTRELHQALREMQLDTRLSQFAGHEIPDACTRLDYVVQLTEQAAHRTLDLVEKSRALADRIAESAEPAVRRDAKELRAQLSELAASQGYQDITGQIIRRVTALVRRVETAMLELLTAAGLPAASAALAAVQGSAPLDGPAVPGTAEQTVSKSASQGEADELLARLGL